MQATIEYEQALTIVRRLDRPTRARLVAQVVQELAVGPDDARRRSNEAWERLAQLREDFARMGPVSPSPAEQLELDRQHRADLLEGRISE
ncbi:MAG: hypothetical protein EI684_01595 [Candidatus Viridilinea halotolerans]|uniref:Addiction module protein n=1 Tax=Candidatus Viridilinea halotolerans TaxID=2491704 RepID=A0A426UA41_9CHLR|nr:MAG: hypothetical protein EI684_01595 [Candidatus Viridilinea halotolerans]